MSVGSTSNSIFPTTRRSACDRCRRQKLRCSSRENASQPCERCVRANLPCHTGYTKPLGRSVGDGLALSSHHSAELSDLEGETPEGTWAYMDMVPSGLQRPSPTITAFDSATSWIIQDGQTIAPGWSQTPASNEVPNDMFVPFTQDSLLTENSLPSYTPVSHTKDGENTPSAGHSHLAPPTPSECSSDDGSISGLRQQMFGKRVSPLSFAECDVRLSQLNIDLSAQLQTCLSLSHLGTTLSEDKANPEQPSNAISSSMGDRTGSSPFGDALRSTSEYLNILLCLQKNPDLDTASSSAMVLEYGRPHATSDGKSYLPVSFACVLNLLSSYLRLITIFDTLFQQLYQEQHGDDSTSPDSSAGLQILPDLHLAGFSVQHGSLQMKILVHAIEHQFELMEKNLGLPVKLRASERRDSYNAGLLQRVPGGRSLLQTMVSEQEAEEGATALFAQLEYSMGAAASLTSLKGSLSRARHTTES